MKKRLLVLVLAAMMALTVLPVTRAASFTFTDVPSTHKHALAIEYCAKQDFVKGYSDTVFAPDSELTREQFALIWARTFHVRTHDFKDVPRITGELDNAIIVMQALGYINGVSDNEFSRSSHISREQALAVAQRTYLRGVDGGEVYKDFTDHASISSWAQNAVGACKTEGLLDGVFSGATLDPQKNITRGEVCHLIYNVMKIQYDITISDMDDGTVVPSAAKAYAGTEITLEVRPEPGKQLKTGSLKANGTPVVDSKFIMPLQDVTITAEFEDEPPVTLSSIAVTTPPSKDEYDVGDTLELDGMVVTATYSNGSTAPVTTYTASPDDGDELTTSGDITITITYSEDTIEKTTTQIVKVSEVL